jgi:hypothetical protein
MQLQLHWLLFVVGLQRHQQQGVVLQEARRVEQRLVPGR